MAKLTSKIAVPIILVGIFAIIVFASIYHDQLNAGFYVVILLFSIYVFFFGLAIGQNLSSPVRKLLDKATELSKGNLSSRVYIESKDELADLANVFNKIAEELQQSSVQEVTTQKSVDMKVRAKTQELQEIITALEQKVKNRTVELEKMITELDKIKADTKDKEIQTAQLKKELDDFKQKIGKYSKAKQIVKKEVSEEENTSL